MSYTSVSPSYYHALRSDSPWEAGAPGWSTAPFVGWGQNPDRSVPPQLAVNGCGCNATGQTDTAPVVSSTRPPLWPLVPMLAAFALFGWAAWQYGKN